MHSAGRSQWQHASRLAVLRIANPLIRQFEKLRYGRCAVAISTLYSNLFIQLKTQKNQPGSSTKPRPFPSNRAYEKTSSARGGSSRNGRSFPGRSQRSHWHPVAAVTAGDYWSSARRVGTAPVSPTRGRGPALRASVWIRPLTWPRLLPAWPLLALRLFTWPSFPRSGPSPSWSPLTGPVL
jgi:hypothetical protein